MTRKWRDKLMYIDHEAPTFAVLRSHLYDADFTAIDAHGMRLSTYHVRIYLHKLLHGLLGHLLMYSTDHCNPQG